MLLKVGDKHELSKCHQPKIMEPISVGEKEREREM